MPPAGAPLGLRGEAREEAGPCLYGLIRKPSDGVTGARLALRGIRVATVHCEMVGGCRGTSRGHRVTRRSAMMASRLLGDVLVPCLLQKASPE